MRFSRRLAAAVLLTVGTVSCTDTRTINTPIPPGKVAGRVSVNPVFSASAKTIAASIADFGITFDRVRVRLRNTPDTNIVVLDTTVTFGPTSNDLVLNLTVPVTEVGQSFNALLEYVGSTGPVYAGTVIVQSYAPDAPTPEQPSLILNFVGPGATLKTLSVAPDPVQLVGSQTTALTIAATDSNGAALAVPPLLFASSDESVARVIGSGATRSVQSFGKRGETRIIATSPIGVEDTLSAIVTLPAAAVMVVSGADQSATVGTQLPQPVVVQVSAADGVGVPGVTVTFTPPAGASVGSPTAVTDADGRASTTITLSNAAGTQAFGISAGSVPAIVVGANARPGPASAATSAIISNGPQFNADNQSSVIISVLTRDQFGNDIGTGGANVTLTTNLGHWGTGTATTTSATDNGDGSYSATLRSAQSGVATITGTVNGVAIAAPPVSVTAIATVLDHFDVTLADGSPITGTKQAGMPISIRITAKDVSGGTVTGYNSQTTISVTNSTLAPGQTATAPPAVAGVSTMDVRLGQPGTNVTIDVADRDKTGHSTPFTVVAGPGTAFKVVGDSIFHYGLNQTPPAYPVVQATDAGGNPVVGQAATFGITGPCTVTRNLVTDSEGFIKFSNETLTIPAGQDFPFSCELSGSLNGVAESTVQIAIVTRRATDTDVWSGNSGDAWETHDNWTISAPSSSMDVWIPRAQPRSAARYPVIRDNTFLAVRSLDVEDMATLDLNGHTLSIFTGGETFSNVDARSLGTVTNGTLAISTSGNGSYIRGRLPNVNVQSGPFRVLEQAQIVGNLNIDAGTLDPSQSVLLVNGDLTTSGGTLLMDAASVVSVSGSVTFSTPAQTSAWTGGSLVVEGNFTQTGANTFNPSGDLTVAIGLHSAQNHTVKFSDTDGSWFQNLTTLITAGATLTIEDAVRVIRQFSVQAPSGGRLFLPQGLSPLANGPIVVIGPVAGTPLVIEMGGGATATNVSTLSFTAGSIVRFIGSGGLNLANGSLSFGANAHITIDATGNFIPTASGRCTRGPGVVIDGTNQNAVDALNNPNICPLSTP